MFCISASQYLVLAFVEAATDVFASKAFTFQVIIIIIVIVSVIIIIIIIIITRPRPALGWSGLGGSL